MKIGYARVSTDPDLMEATRAFVDAWLTHLYTPGTGTPTRYCEARASLTKLVYPEYQGPPKQHREILERLAIPREYGPVRLEGPYEAER